MMLEHRPGYMANSKVTVNQLIHIGRIDPAVDHVRRCICYRFTIYLNNSKTMWVESKKNYKTKRGARIAASLIGNRYHFKIEWEIE